MASDAPRPDVLAAALAGRLIHDVMGPLSGVISGLDLLADPKARDMHDDALALATTSARDLREAMAFSRALYGASAAAMDPAALEAHARGLFAQGRASLDWTIELDTVSAPTGRALLGFVRLAQSAVVSGGTVVARAQAAPVVTVSVEAAGPRLRLTPEAKAGLAGQPFTDGLIGQWAPAYHLWAQAVGAGGTVATRFGETSLRLEARFPG